MKRFAVILLAAMVCIQPAKAQEDEGSSMMERGAQQFLEGLLKEMEPALEGLRAFMEQMGPAMMNLLDEVKDWSVYEPPEVLENGDIIIRRKPSPEKPEEDAPQVQPADPVPQIEL
jgi:hypothetical protein